MSKTIINVMIDDESYLMPVKRKRIKDGTRMENLPCLHCGSQYAWTVLTTEQLPMFNPTPRLYFVLVVCPDCQCASEYRCSL